MSPSQAMSTNPTGAPPRRAHIHPKLCLPICGATRSIGSTVGCLNSPDRHDEGGCHDGQSELVDGAGLV